MRKLMVVLVAVAFLAGASFVHAEDNGEENGHDDGEYALAGDIKEVKELLKQVLAELEKLNAAVAYTEASEDTVVSLLGEIRDAMQAASSSAP